jgi:hypothetical protein
MDETVLFLAALLVKVYLRDEGGLSTKHHARITGSFESAAKRDVQLTVSCTELDVLYAAYDLLTWRPIETDSVIRSAAPRNGSNAVSPSLVTADARDPPFCRQSSSVGRAAALRQNGHSAKRRALSRADRSGLRRDDLQPAAALARPFTDHRQTPAAPGLTDPSIQHLRRPRGHAMPDTPRTVPCSPRASNASITASIRPGRQSRLAGPEVRPHLTPPPAPSRSKSAPTPLGVRTDHIAVTEEKVGNLINRWLPPGGLRLSRRCVPVPAMEEVVASCISAPRALLRADRCPSCGRA